MTLSLALETINDLPRTAASDVKKLGWRGAMKAVDRAGKVVVTHHDEPQAVILSTAAYHEILQALQQARAKNQSALETLRHRFDDRLASLQEADAGKRLRMIIRGRVRLGGKVSSDRG